MLSQGTTNLRAASAAVAVLIVVLIIQWMDSRHASSYLRAGTVVGWEDMLNLPHCLSVNMGVAIFGLLLNLFLPFYIPHKPQDTVGSKQALVSSGMQSTENASPNVFPPLADQLARVNRAEFRELTFIHIPKTGGSSIVAASIPHNLTWGDCLFADRSINFHCSRHSIQTRPCPAHPWGSCAKHTPIQWLHSDRCPPPYAEKDIFAVVRNPYERAVSEYYYFCAFHHSCNLDLLNDGPYMNTWLQERIRKLTLCTRVYQYNTNITHQIHGLKSCHSSHCFHDVSQYDFVHGGNVTWVLRNEDLAQEFPMLMRAYGLPATLPVERVNSGSGRLSAANLTRETAEMLETFYHNDFEAFGYTRMEQANDGQST